MAAVLAETDSAKAAVVSSGPDMVHMSFPITKREDTGTINPVDGTPDIEIWGKATDGTLDSDLQIVDPDWSLAALKEWFDTKANIRMSHDPKQPVGKGIDIDGHYVRARIADPKAKHFIREGVLNDFSVGIMNPDVRKGDPRFRHLDPQGKAIHGIITGRPDGLSGFGEISVVDRGANYGSSFALVKAAADGTPEWVGELTTPADSPAGSGLTTLELPSDMKLKVTPSILAKMATLKRDLVLKEQAQGQPEVITKAAEPAAAEPGPEALPEYHAMKAAEAAVYKRDIDTATRRRLAGEGHALPNLSYPIENNEDLQNAATLARSGHGDVPAARRLIAREARERKVPNPLKAKKAAAPEVVKCKCTAGMMDGVPCTKCKAGKRMAEKAAKPDAVKKKKGKMRAICPNCGAKQNPAHAHCPECGKPLPARAIQVKKNHDFVCLGCGHDLDKGEPHCPGCGKENPGYLPEADRKIPSNLDADKSAGKDRVAKAKKKSGKKGKPFGGSQAKPFGAADEKDKPDAKAEKRRKGKGKGRSPAEGVTGHETTGLPPHREPDGAPVEQFENDAHLEDGDQQMKAALRHKSLGIEPHLAVLHDLTCPAFSPSDVARALPYASLGGIDTAWWQKAALDAAAGESFEKAAAAFNNAQALSQAAVTLKTADPDVMLGIRMANHEAFLAANRDLIKTFRDATPGPGSAPTPGHVMPQSFRRPYISAGHAAESPQAEGARTFPVISDHPQAQDFQRGYLSAGHASESPENSEPRSAPVPEGSAGRPEAVSYAGMQQRDYEAARSAMHDHLSRIAPGMCAMSPPMGSTQKPGHPVPEAVGGPVPHRAGKASRADKLAAKARKAKKAAKAAQRKADARRRKIGERVLKGKLSPEEAQAQLGITVKAAVPSIPAAGPLAEASAPVQHLDPDALAAALKSATAPLVKRIKAQDKAIRKNQKVLDAVAGQPDTSQAPFRGTGVYKASAAPVAPQTVAEASAMAQNANIQRLRHDWRNSHIPEVREAAYKELTAQLGINPMTQNPAIQNPFTS